jgi:hypothetical protein
MPVMDPQAMQRKMLVDLMLGQQQAGVAPTPQANPNQPLAPPQVTPPPPGSGPLPFQPPMPPSGRRSGY